MEKERLIKQLDQWKAECNEMIWIMPFSAHQEIQVYEKVKEFIELNWDKPETKERTLREEIRGIHNFLNKVKDSQVSKQEEITGFDITYPAEKLNNDEKIKVAIHTETIYTGKANKMLEILKKELNKKVT